MNSIKIKDIIGKKIAIQCKTHEESRDLLREIENEFPDIKWRESENPISKDLWLKYKDKWCLNMNGAKLLTYGNYDWYIENHYEIIQAEGILKEKIEDKLKRLQIQDESI